MTVQHQYDSLDRKQRLDVLLKVGKTREEARMLSQRDYDALGGWVKPGSRDTGSTLKSKTSARFRRDMLRVPEVLCANGNAGSLFQCRRCPVVRLARPFNG